MIQIDNIADLVNPNDKTGRTYREVNLATGHTYPVGALVELDTGLRLTIVSITRDCDGTPLYNLGQHGTIHTYGVSEESIIRTID